MGIRQLLIIFLNCLLFDRTVFILKFFKVFYVARENAFIHMIVYMPSSIQLDFFSMILLEFLVQLHLLLIKFFSLLRSIILPLSLNITFRSLSINCKVVYFSTLFRLLAIFYICKYTAWSQITFIILNFGPAWISHHRSWRLILSKQVFMTII